MKKITKNLEETQILGKEMGENAKKGESYLLFGDLGSGKTSFVQGFAKGLGLKNRILSPTFVIMRNYKAKKAHFNHMDLYRLSTFHELEEAGVFDALRDLDSINAIEWAEKLGEIATVKGYKISFSYINPNEREIIVDKI